MTVVVMLMVVAALVMVGELDDGGGGGGSDDDHGDNHDVRHNDGDNGDGSQGIRASLNRGGACTMFSNCSV